MMSAIEHFPIADQKAALSAVLQAALLCAQNGWSVYPLQRAVDGQCTCGEEHPERFTGVHTACGRSHVSATCDEQIIAGWWEERPELNFAVSMSKNVANTECKVRIVETAGSLPEAEAELAKWAAALEVDLNIGMIVATPRNTHQFYLYVPSGLEIKAQVAGGLTVFQHDSIVPGPGSVDFSGEYVSIVPLRKDVSSALVTAALVTSGAEVLSVPAASADDNAQLEEQVEITVADMSGDSDLEQLLDADSGTDIVVDTHCNHAYSGTGDEEAAPAIASPEHTTVAEKAQARMKKMRQAAASYIECGWQLCAIENGSKRPYTEQWQHNPLKLEDVGYHGLGLIHALSDTVVIDVDDFPAAEALLANEGIDLNEHLHDDDAVQIRSGRANRAKLLYRLPPGFNVPGVKQFKHSNGAMILEFRGASVNGKGCQDVLPPSVHPETQQEYQWAGAGDYRNLPMLPNGMRLMWERAMASTSKVVNKAPENVSEGSRNDTLFRIAGDLVRQNLSAGGIEAALMAENQAKCFPPLPENEVRAIAKSAQRNSNGAKERVEVPDHAAIIAAARDADRKVKASEAKSGSHERHLPAVMSAIADFYSTTSRTVQPAFVLATALAACGAVLARDFKGANGAHTNLYCIAMGPTACGKENALDTVKKMVAAYDAQRLAGAPTSDGGVLAAMQRNPASSYVIDEIGEYLKSVFDKKAASYQAKIGTVWMELYTKAGKRYIGREYARQTGRDGRPREDIESPCPSIFGATTATTFYGGMQAGEVSSGFLPRLMVFRAPDRIPPPNLHCNEAEIPQEVVTWAKEISERVSAHRAQLSAVGGNALTVYQPIDVPYSAEAKELVNAEMIRIVDRRNSAADQLESDMLSRVVENSGRVALILALTADASATEVSAANFAHAFEIVTASTETFIADLRANLFDSSSAMLETKVLAQIKRMYIEENKPVSDGILTNRCRPYKSARLSDKKATIESLARQGKIVVENGRNAGSVKYYPTEHSFH